MTNIIGEVVHEWSIQTNTPADKEIRLPAGIYILSIEYDDEINTTRIIKQ